MAVKFVRTCDKCGKVIREGSANDTMTVGEGNSLNFYTKDEHKSYDICDECAEAFVKFMNGWVDLRDALSEEKAYVDFDECCLPADDILSEEKSDVADFYSKEYKMRRTIEDVHEHFGGARPENVCNPHAWSNEVLRLCPEAKDGYDADAVKKVLEDYDIKLKQESRTNHRWTKEEDVFLIEERRRKVKTPEMAKKLGLSVSQVRTRIKYLDKLRKEKKNVKTESDGRHEEPDKKPATDEVVFGLDGTVYTQDKDKQGWTGWSPEALELARQHNEQITNASIDSEPMAQTPSKDKTKIKLAPGTHTYHYWTAEEDRAILKSSGKTLNDLACQFGTTITAVRARKHLILNGKVDIDREN